jgi:hypothetical protein
MPFPDGEWRIGFSFLLKPGYAFLIGLLTPWEMEIAIASYPRRGWAVSDAKRLKALEDENAKLKKLLACSTLGIQTDGAES